MTLPPLADLFAFHSADERLLADVGRRMEAVAPFASVRRPAPGWVLGVAPLPGGPAEPESVADSGLVFVEGRDRVLGDDPSPQRVADVRDLVRRTPEQLNALPGDFGLLDVAQDGTATVVRSCGGLVPLYFAGSRAGLAIGTRLDFFARFTDLERRLDPLATAVWLTGSCFFPNGRTPLYGVSMVPRGHYAVPGAKPLAPRPYWDPRPFSAAELVPSPDHARRLRALLVGTLERELDADGNNLLTLSGGADSSSLGALAAGTLGRRVSTLTLLPAVAESRAHELRYIESLRGSYPFGSEWRIVLERNQRMDLLASAPPVAFPVLNPALWALPRVLRDEPVSVLFGGECGDEICGAYVTLPDWVRHTSAASLVRNLSELPMGPRDVVRWARRRAANAVGRPVLQGVASGLGSWAARELDEEYRVWRAGVRRRLARDARPLRNLAFELEADAWIAMNWEAASSLGIRRCIPFHTREAIELAFACHPRELVGPGTKKLLRAALRGDVPAVNLDRQDRGEWGVPPAVEREWASPLPDELSGIVRADLFPKPSAPLGHDDWAAIGILDKFVQGLRYAASGIPERRQA